MQEGTSILAAARIAGIIVEAPCNGMGTCGKCTVRVDTASLDNITYSADYDFAQDKDTCVLLSCLACVRGDVSVFLDESRNAKTGSASILDYAKPMNVEHHGFIGKRFIAEQNITRVYGGHEILGIEDGNTENRSYGIVIDIGTTTLVASLTDMSTGQEIASSVSLNPQCFYAHDVLSRIMIASRNDGLSLMHSGLVKEINRMLGEAAISAGVSTSNIYEVVYSGNTCMLHLAIGVNPHSLGRYPYKPQISGGNYLNAREKGLDISQFGILYLPPIISGYVGADITSGILASDLHNRKGSVLFVDIGTNGEMVLASGSGLCATSTAAGPAFEGMNIACGMRADKGAVEYFRIEDSGEVIARTIENTKAVGICGSGLIDIVAELVSHGIVANNGKFADPRTEHLPHSLRQRIVRQGGETCFLISDGVYVSQKDIRQVQLAKGAVRAGIEILLHHSNMTASDVDTIYIAGAFGYHLRPESLIDIGLLPGEFAHKVEFLGNTSKSGGRAFLLNETLRSQMKDVADTVKVVDLAGFSDFQKTFVKCLRFEKSPL